MHYLAQCRDLVANGLVDNAQILKHSQRLLEEGV
jgi:hypothetical protein